MVIDNSEKDVTEKMRTIDITSGDEEEEKTPVNETEEIKPETPIISSQPVISSPPLFPTSGLPKPLDESSESVTEATTSSPQSKAPAVNTASQISIKIDEPHKIGDGIGSYMVYSINTKTTLPYFRKQSLTVSRRFSDFLGLHEKLLEKHSHLGRIVPPPPAKNAVGTAKIKISKDDNATSSEFLEKRRASLERYLQRNAEHPIICADPDFREFLELDTELPRSTSTSALSGAGVKRLFSYVGDTVNKITFRMDELDPVIFV